MLILVVNELIHSSILVWRCKQNRTYLGSIAYDLRKWTWGYDNIKALLENRVSETWGALQIDIMN